MSRRCKEHQLRLSTGTSIRAVASGIPGYSNRLMYWGLCKLLLGGQKYSVCKCVYRIQTRINCAIIDVQSALVEAGCDSLNCGLALINNHGQLQQGSRHESFIYRRQLFSS